MTDKSTNDNANNDASGRGDFFTQFSPAQRDRMKEVWDLAGRTRPASPEIAGNVVEEALSEVRQHINESTNTRSITLDDKNHDDNHLHKRRPPTPDDRSLNIKNKWRWWLAAAVVLFIFGAGLLLMPQTVTAPRGEMARITLPDGSTVELNSGSQIQYNRFFAFTNRTIDLEGEAFFSVSRDDRPFIVNANKATVQVSGTEFNVRSWSGEFSKETEVTVAEGTVHFYPLDDPENLVTVSKGEFSRWMAEMERPTLPEAVSIDKMLGWREKKLVFNEKPLLVIFQELERRYDINIQLYDTTMASETLTAFYARPQNIESVIKDICRVKGLRYAKTANGFSVYR